MKKWIGLLIVASCGFVSYAHADNAVGVVLGDPTGISGRMSLDSQHSLEGAFAYSSSSYEGLHLRATYLWDRARTFQTAADPLYMYYGLGLRVISISRGKYDGDIAFGPRAPIGVLYNIDNPNLELFAELSLAVDLVPKTDVDIDGGIGVRIRF